MTKPDPNFKNAFEPPVAALVAKDPPQTSGLAIGSFVCGLLSLFLSCLTGIIGLILGIIALTQIGSSNGRLKGTGLAITGIILSIILSLIPLFIAMLLPAVQQVRAAARRAAATNSMRQIMLAQHNYEAVHKKFPGERIGSDRPGSGLSWRVHILPFLERQDLYEQFNFDEPWDSPHNKTLIPLMPEIYKSVGGLEEPLQDEGETVYLRPIGNGAFSDPAGEDFKAISFAQIVDGTYNTICLVEADASEAVIWTQPDGDYHFDPNDPMRGLGNQRIGVVLVGYCDASVMGLPKSLPPPEWKSRFTLNAGDPVTYSEY